MAFLLDLLLAIAKPLLGKWLGGEKKDPEKERMKDDLTRSKENQEILSAPRRERDSVLERMRQRNRETRK